MPVRFDTLAERSLWRSLGAVLVLWAACGPALADPPTDRPRYLLPTLDRTVGVTVERISDDAGRPIAHVQGTWGLEARHVYSKQQPWNSDQSLLSLENREGGSPSTLLLDGTTYAPRSGRCDDYPRYDWRWHPSTRHPHEQINVDRSGRELMWFDVVRCVKTRSWTLPVTVDYGIGSGEGNPSNDGRFVALGNNRQMFVVDMDPQPPYAPYPHVRIGPVYVFPPESLTIRHPDAWKLDNLSISSSGHYVDVKFDLGPGESDSTEDAHRIFEVDPATLALRPHAMAQSSRRCGSFGARPNGWILPLKHSDLALDPFDGNADVVVGGLSCPGPENGRLAMVRLRDGKATWLTAGPGVAPVSHVSTRNLRRPGWAYVSYFASAGRRFSDEIVAVRIDGSGAVERFGRTHTAAAGCYRCEAHPAPSPDGRRVLFASNWAADCTACGPHPEIKAYVVARSAMGVFGPAPRAPSEGQPRRPARRRAATQPARSR